MEKTLTIEGEASGIATAPEGAVLAGPFANEGVRSLFVPDGGERAVARMDHGVLWKRPQAGVDGAGKQVEISTRMGQVGAPDGASEQGVARKQVVRSTVHAQPKADATKGVARCVDHVEAKASNVEDLSMLKVMVSDGRLGKGREAPPCRCLGREGLQEGVIGVQPPFNIPVGAHGGDVSAVVKVGVRVEQGNHLAVTGFVLRLR